MVGWLFSIGRKTNGKFLLHNIWLTSWTSTSKFGSFLLRLGFLSWGLSSRTFLSWGLNVDLIIWMQGLVCAPGSLSLALPSALTQCSLDITMQHSTELMPLLRYILCFFKKNLSLPLNCMRPATQFRAAPFCSGSHGSDSAPQLLLPLEKSHITLGHSRCLSSAVRCQRANRLSHF